MWVVNVIRKMVLVAGLLVATLVPASVKAVDWYVDADVGTNGNGQSWATAWKQLHDIAWSSVNPGDTIWVSGGEYYGVLNISKSGTPLAPIRLKKAQVSGHRDLATLHGRISISGDWVIIDGALDDSYSSQISHTYAVPQIKSNIGFKVNSQSVKSHAINVWGSGPNGLRILWLELTTGPTGGKGEAGFYSAIRINAGDIQNTEVAYNWVHDTDADGVKCSQDDIWAPHSITIHHNLIERIGDDGIVHNGGATIHHNIVRDTLELTGHPDGIVGMGDNTYIYNNVIYDWNTEPLYPSLRNANHANFFVYGNLIYNEDLPESNEACTLFTVDGSFPWKRLVSSNPDVYEYISSATWANVVIANNTFIAGRAINDPFNMTNRYCPAYRPGEPGLVVNVRNWIVKNNIFYGGKSVAARFKGSEGLGWSYTESDLVVQNNVFYSSNPDGNRIEYLRPTYFPNAEAMDAATANSGNRSSRPLFMGGFDFRLSSSDTAARGHGQNLANLGLPGIEYDIWGNYRGAQAWDIGSMAFRPEGRPSAPQGLRINGE